MRIVRLRQWNITLNWDASSCFSFIERVQQIFTYTTNTITTTKTTPFNILTPLQKKWIILLLLLVGGGMEIYETEGNNAAELIISTPHGIPYTLIPLCIPSPILMIQDTRNLLSFRYQLLWAISNWSLLLVPAELTASLNYICVCIKNVALLNLFSTMGESRVF